MPELAAVFTLGFLACLSLTILYVFLRERRRRSGGATVLQANLAKAGLYWSDSADALIPLTPTSAIDEARRSKFTIGLTGIVLSLLSWIGVFFLLVIMISERFLARSRRERRLFGSSLAHASGFDAAAVERELDQLNVLNSNPAEAARPI